MQSNVECCHAKDFLELLTYLDKEFIFSKNRFLSLAMRFPHTFSADNLENIYVIKEGGIVSSAVAVRHFDWYTGVRNIRGAMIGAVYTKPEHRGKGLASCILCKVKEDLRKRYVKFAVLWTKLSDFYQKLGWHVKDVSVFGEVISTKTKSQKSFLVVSSKLEDCDFQWIDAVHSKYTNEHVVRTRRDYDSVPLPVNSVEAFILKESTKIQGYAIVGRLQKTGYLYELVGNPSCFPSIWESLIASFDKVLINDRQDSLSYHWLTKNSTIQWHRQRLTTWLYLSDLSEYGNIGKWYIPYMDRI